MTDGRRHPANLPVFPLGKIQLDPAFGDVLAGADRRVTRGDLGLRVEEFGEAGSRGMPSDHNSLAQQSKGVRRGDALDLCPVAAWMSVLGVEEAGIEPPFVREEEESFGIGIKSAERVDILRKSKLGQGPVR